MVADDRHISRAAAENVRAIREDARIDVRSTIGEGTNERVVRVLVPVRFMRGKEPSEHERYARENAPPPTGTRSRKPHSSTILLDRRYWCDRQDESRDRTGRSGGGARARWSPDGRLLAFTGVFEDTAGSGIYVVGADGSGMRRLAPWALARCGAGWSPVGRRIVFMRSARGKWSPYVMPAAGGTATLNRKLGTRQSGMAPGRLIALEGIPLLSPAGHPVR